MIDYMKLAIADLIKHPVLGTVSHQPDLREPESDRIRVRDRKGILHFVNASECDRASEKDREGYWENFPSTPQT